jgi:uncharacterized protein
LSSLDLRSEFYISAASVIQQRRYHVAVKAAILFLALCLPAWADLAAGQQAIKNGDYATALKEFLPLARQGNPDAQFNLGNMVSYIRRERECVRPTQPRLDVRQRQGREARLRSNGQGVTQDYAEAVRWYRKSAEQGNAFAQLNLGFMYAHGQGVTQDYAEAAKWYRKSAEQGNADAQNNLGLMYDNGQGVTQDYVEAHMWLNLAASKSNGEDQNRRSDLRDAVAKKMTPQQIAEAQRRAREWKPTTPK